MYTANPLRPPPPGAHLCWQVGSEPGVAVDLLHRDARVRVAHHHARQQVAALWADLDALGDGPLGVGGVGCGRRGERDGEERLERK